MLWARPQDSVTDVRGRAGVEGTVLAQDSAETDPGKDHGIFVGEPVIAGLYSSAPIPRVPV